MARNKSTILVLIEGHDEQRPVIRGLTATMIAGPHSAYRAPLDEISDVVVVTSGVGPAQAGRVAAECIDRFDPVLVVSAGTCGALGADMQMSDWLITGTVRSLGNAAPDGRTAGETLQSPASEVISRLVRAIKPGPRTHSGVLVTVSDKPVVDAAEKATIAARHDAVAVDMESFGIARAAADRGIPWLIARVVVDTPACPLPELGPMNIRTGRPPLRGIALYVLKNPVTGPRTLYGLWALVQAYARVFVRVLPSLAANGRAEGAISSRGAMQGVGAR